MNALKNNDGPVPSTVDGNGGDRKSPLTDPAAIKALTAEAYLWGLGPEYIQRFSKLSSLTHAPINFMHYGKVPGAWNNGAYNAGNSTALYISAFVDLTDLPLVLTVPPSNSQYYVAAYMDAYTNTVGSIGTRTTPSEHAETYLVVGPNSPYAKLTSVKIGGFTYAVLGSDTNLNWMVVRLATNTLICDDDPQSTARVYKNTSLGFALNRLDEFQQNGNKPIYSSGQPFVPTEAELAESKFYQSTPKSAVEFFEQLGTLVKNNPIPPADCGLSGTLLADLPAWVVRQFGASDKYCVPSYGQQTILERFRAIGLDTDGFRIPSEWGPDQLHAFQEGYTAGEAALLKLIEGVSGTADKNYWTFLNLIVGTYPSNEEGYTISSIVVNKGGVANIAADGVYPTTTTVGTTSGPQAMDGNQTYSITFTPPPLTMGTLPIVGIYPPEVTDNSGQIKGYWSLTVYQPDPTDSSSPFLSQASVLNLHYSSATHAVVAVEPDSGLISVIAPDDTTIVTSTPILFGSNAEAYGLRCETVYYVSNEPIVRPDPITKVTTYQFRISEQWIQELSKGNVAIQNSGKAGKTVDFLVQPPTGTGALTYGLVRPVSQLGSPQLKSGQLTLNEDGSLTLWVAPALPANAYPSNWIPTPSTEYFRQIYSGDVNTAIMVFIRMYYPTPGECPPSILPYNHGTLKQTESYIPPAFKLIADS